jgi:hypothetical protein
MKEKLKYHLVIVRKSIKGKEVNDSISRTFSSPYKLEKWVKENYDNSWIHSRGGRAKITANKIKKEMVLSSDFISSDFPANSIHGRVYTHYEGKIFCDMHDAIISISNS